MAREMANDRKILEAIRQAIATSTVYSDDAGFPIVDEDLAAEAVMKALRKSKLIELTRKIYFISAKQIEPVGAAGAVVIAENVKEAMALAMDKSDHLCTLYNPDKPKLIGHTTRKSQVVFINDTNY